MHVKARVKLVNDNLYVTLSLNIKIKHVYVMFDVKIT